jgi:catechol 2,3-dioxygenase-like lactoylglutathione lyase family enzyme
VIHTIHHVAVGVPDLDAGLAFYVGALGCEQLWRSRLDGTRQDADSVIGIDGVEADVAMLRLGGVHIELWAYQSPAPVDRRSPANGFGYPHIALTVSDIAAEHARLSEAGMTFVGPPVDLVDSRAVYGRDPFGNLIELYETPT